MIERLDQKTGGDDDGHEREHGHDRQPPAPLTARHQIELQYDKSDAQHQQRRAHARAQYAEATHHDRVVALAP